MIRAPQSARGLARRPVLLGAAALVYLVSAVFFPILGFEFSDLDVPEQVLYNPSIRGLSMANLKRIMSTADSGSYYPIRSLTFACDYQLWGLRPAGFALTSGLIHLANVLLLFWLVLRLLQQQAGEIALSPSWRDVLLASFSAAVFAIHPVVVEPVAWLGGREELLMCLGVLGCLHFHLCAQAPPARGGAAAVVAYRIAAVLCGAGACLSNAAGAAVPLLVTAWETVRIPRLRLSTIVWQTLPFWLLAAATIAIKVSAPFEPQLIELEPYAAVREQLQQELVPRVDPADAFSPQRLLVVLNLYALNLKTLFWPTRLTIAYRNVEPQTFWEPAVMLGAAAVVITAALLWLCRKQRLLLFGLLWFCLALAPAAQLLPHHLHRGDRFLYLPLVGLTIALAAALRPLIATRTTRAAAVLALAAGLGGLIVLDSLSARQVRTWQNGLSTWEHTVRVDPENVLGHVYFADNLLMRGAIEPGLEHLQIAVRLEPRILDTMEGLAREFSTRGAAKEPDYQFAIRVAQLVCQLSAWQRPEHVATLAEVYARAGQTQEAEAAARRALTLAEAKGNAEVRQRLSVLPAARGAGALAPAAP